jgi:transcription initiation factor TFIIIB Brf1 subunit/transcription initiation factor TFIIB
MYNETNTIANSKLFETITIEETEDTLFGCFANLAMKLRFTKMVINIGRDIIETMSNKADSGTQRSLNTQKYFKRWASALCYQLYRIYRYQMPLTEKHTIDTIAEISVVDRKTIWQYTQKIIPYTSAELGKGALPADPIAEIDLYFSEMPRKKETKLLTKIVMEEAKEVFHSGRPIRSVIAGLNYIVNAMFDTVDISDYICRVFNITKVSLKSVILFLANKIGISAKCGTSIQGSIYNEKIASMDIDTDKIIEQYENNKRFIILKKTTAIQKFIAFSTLALLFNA